jgi:hypothetical protein
MSEPSLTRRAALAAGAAGAAGIALTSDAAGAATKVSAARYNRTIIVQAPKEIVFDLEQVQAIQRDILGQLGCRACCSGFDFHFPDELEYVFPAQGVRVQEITPQEIAEAAGDS